MAKSQSLKLSDLRPGVDYSVTGPQEQSERRCLFLVKLTDFSMRSIESLINSDKDACFSLWFGDGGGTIGIPGGKKFAFKTSQGDIDGLECVHQALDSAKQPRLNCWGQIRYKLQVQGTEEVYKRTMKLMKETEEQKQKTRTQTINFPHSSSSKGRSKSGRPRGVRPVSKTSSPFSAPSVPPSSHSFSSSSASGGGGGGSSFSSKFSAGSGGTLGGSGSGGGTGTTANGTSGPSGGSSGKSSGNRKSSKAPHTLKERIIHLLAVRPQRRSDIINRLKKETKRGETAMTKTDALLQEVADAQGDMYHLKSSLFSELRVDDWPFYSDAERQLVKRRHGGGGDFSDKRPSGARDPPHAKRQKLSHPPPSSSPHPPPQTHTARKPSPPPFPNSSSSTATVPRLNMPLFGMDSSSSLANPSSNIEMQSLTSTNSILSSHSVSNQIYSSSSSSTSKPQTQYPGLVFSNFVRSSASLPPSSSSPLPLPLPPHSATQGSAPNVRKASKPEQQQLQPVTSLPTGQTGYSVSRTSSGGGVTSVDGEGGVAAVLPMATGGKGKLFGDLVQSGGGVPSEPPSAEAADLGKKKKKKKSAHKTRDKGLSNPAEEKGSVVKSEGVREGRGKREEVGEGVPVKSEQTTTLEENGASSTTPSSMDLDLLFPPITSDVVRAEYKKIFNDEYQEYLDLKGQVEVVHKEVTVFNDQMAAVKKGTEEAKILKRKIRGKYTELQLNEEYQSQKRRFQELHTKLGHIKKLVVAYDQSH